jgi:hypothetical protein
MTTEAEAPNGKPTIPDAEIIERFGGIRPMASKLGVAVTTVQGWKERGHIPEGRHAQIMQAAAKHGVDIGLEKAPAREPAKAAPAKPPEPKPVEETRPEEKKPEPVAVEPERPAPEPEPADEPAEETAPAPVEPTAPPPPAGGVSWVTLFAVVILLGGAILTGPLWQSKLYPGGGTAPAPVDTGRLDEIAAGLARIEVLMKDLRRDLDAGERKLSGRIDALEAGGGETGAAFAEQLAAIEKGVANLAGALGALESGLSGIESRVANLEAVKGELPDSVKTSLDALESRTSELTRAMGDQERSYRDGVASVGENLAGLEARVAALETRPVQTGEKIAALVLALGQVESGMNSGKPYRAALDRLETLGRDDPLISGGEAVAALSPWADYGIPDRLALRRRFTELAPDIDRALSGAEEGNWLDSVWNSVTGLVTIRKIDGVNLTPIGQAEQALERGDLTGAAAAFEGKGSLGPEGDAWLNLVEARIDAEREIDSLYGQMISPLAGDTGGDGAAAQ